MTHFPAAHAVFAYLALDLDDPTVDGVAAAEKSLSALDAAQLARIAAKADQLSTMALSLAAPRRSDTVPQLEVFPRPIWHTDPAPVVGWSWENPDDADAFVLGILDEDGDDDGEG